MKLHQLYTHLLLGAMLIFWSSSCHLDKKVFKIEQQEELLKFYNVTLKDDWKEAFWNHFHNSDLISQELYFIDLDFDNTPEILLYESRGSGGIMMGDIYAYKNGLINKINIHTSELRLFKNIVTDELIWISINEYKVGSEYVDINYDICDFSNILQPHIKELYNIIQYFDYGDINMPEDIIIDKQTMNEISKEEFEKIKSNFFSNYSEVQYKQVHEKTNNLNYIDSDSLKDLGHNLFINLSEKWSESIRN